MESKTPLGRRLRDVRSRLNIDERDAFAEELGISKGALAHYERGERVPDATVLAAYQERFGVNLSWLVTGDGAMFSDPSKAPAPTLPMDPELLETIYKNIEMVHRATELKTPPHKLAVLAAEMYNELLARVVDVRDKAIVSAVLPVLGDELRERLREATSEPGSGKRSAS